MHLKITITAVPQCHLQTTASLEPILLHLAAPMRDFNCCSLVGIAARSKWRDVAETSLNANIAAECRLVQEVETVGCTRTPHT